MPLPFRQRIFVILVALTAVPTALAVVGWALAVRTVAPSAGARVALEEVAASARLMVDRMDTTHLSLREREAFREHLEQLSNSVTLARRAETYLRYYAGGSADPRRSGVRSAAPGAARARHGARRRARARARGGALAGVPRGGAAGRARDQEPAHGHADRGRSARADDGTVGPSDGDGGGRARSRDRATGPAREGVRRVRSPPRGAEERGGSRGPPGGPGPERGAVGGGCLGAGQRGALQAVGALRSPAARVREPVAQRLGGDGRARVDRDRGDPGRERARGDHRRPWSRDPRRPAPAGVRAVLHDQERRNGPGARPRTPDDRGPQRQHHRGGD